MIWAGGTYHPFVDASSFDANGWGNADFWKIFGKLTIRNDAMLSPSGVDGENNQVVPDSLKHWRLFWVVSGITNAPNTPTLNPSSTWAVIDKVQNPVDEWDLRSV